MELIAAGGSCLSDSVCVGVTLVACFGNPGVVFSFLAAPS